jgi:uncharacterized protein (TIGR02594 family)
MTPDEMRDARLKLAVRYVGLEEVEDKEELEDFIGFDPSKTAWCAGFVNALEKKLGNLGTGKLTARSFLKYGASVLIPRPGDIVVFKRGNSTWEGHVALFVRFNDDVSVQVLGGNQNNKVCYKAYPLGDVLGYRMTL